jgi:hypothetical protein
MVCGNSDHRAASDACPVYQTVAAAPGDVANDRPRRLRRLIVVTGRLRLVRLRCRRRHRDPIRAHLPGDRLGVRIGGVTRFFGRTARSWSPAAPPAPGGIIPLMGIPIGMPIPTGQSDGTTWGTRQSDWLLVHNIGPILRNGVVNYLPVTCARPV